MEIIPIILVLAYFAIGLAIVIHDWHTELRYEYKLMLESGEKPDDNSLVIYWYLLTVLWPPILIIKACRRLKRSHKASL